MSTTLWPTAPSLPNSPASTPPTTGPVLSETQVPGLSQESEEASAENYEMLHGSSPYSPGTSPYTPNEPSSTPFSVLPSEQEPGSPQFAGVQVTAADETAAAPTAQSLSGLPSQQPTAQNALLGGYNEGLATFAAAHPEISQPAQLYSAYNQVLVAQGANPTQVAALSSQSCLAEAENLYQKGDMNDAVPLLAFAAASWKSLPQGQNIDYAGQSAQFGSLVSDSGLWTAGTGSAAGQAGFVTVAQGLFGSSVGTIPPATPATSPGVSPSASPGVPPASPGVPPASPTVPPASPVVPPASPAVPPASPVVPPASPAVPPASPVVPPASPAVPPASPAVPAPPASPAVPPASPAVPPASPAVPPASPAVPPASPSASPPSLMAGAPAGATDAFNNLPNGQLSQMSFSDFSATVGWLNTLPASQQQAQEQAFDQKYPNTGIGASLAAGVTALSTSGNDPNKAALAVSPGMQALASSNPQLAADLRTVSGLGDPTKITTAQWSGLINDLSKDTNGADLTTAVSALNSIYPNVANGKGVGDLLQMDVKGAQANPPTPAANLPAVAAAGGVPNIPNASPALKAWLAGGCQDSSNPPALSLSDFRTLVGALGNTSSGPALQAFMNKVNPKGQYTTAAIKSTQNDGFGDTNDVAAGRFYPPNATALPGLASNDKHTNTLLGAMLNPSETLSSLNNGQVADIEQIMVNVYRQGSGAGSNYQNMLGQIQDTSLRNQVDSAVKAWTAANPTAGSKDGSTGSGNCWQVFNNNGKSHDYSHGL